MNPDNAIAAQRQQVMMALSDDPDQWRRAPFSELYGACLSAKYGPTDDGPGVEWGPF
jgi:hypothetical protein